MTRIRRLSAKEESTRMFSPMNCPLYLSEKDRDEAYDAMMSCSTVATIRTLTLTAPNLDNTIRAQRVRELAEFFTKRQRAKTKKHMYKKLFLGN